MSMPDFSDEEWEELLSSYQTLINDIAYVARANGVPSPGFNCSFVSDSDCDNYKEKNYFSELLQQPFLITPRSKPSPCQKHGWFKVSTM